MSYPRTQMEKCLAGWQVGNHSIPFWLNSRRHSVCFYLLLQVESQVGVSLLLIFT